MLEVLQKPAVEPVRFKVTFGIEPPAIAGDGVGRVESQTGEGMGGDFRAFLGRQRVDRVKPAELRCEQPEHAQLPVDRFDAPVAAKTGIYPRIGKNDLP